MKTRKNENFKYKNLFATEEQGVFKTETGELVKLPPPVWERRDEVYVLKLYDGEIEFTEMEFQEHIDSTSKLQDFINEYCQKYSHQNWKIGEAPREAHLFLSFDIFFEKLEKRIVDDLGNGDIKQNFKTTYALLDLMETQFSQSAINPFSKSKNIYDYSTQHIQVIRKKIKTYERISKNKQQAKLFRNKQGLEAEIIICAIENGKELFIKGETGNAIEFLLKELGEENPLVLLSNRLKAVEEQKINGIISLSKYNRLKNKIGSDLLKFIDNVIQNIQKT